MEMNKTKHIIAIIKSRLPKEIVIKRLNDYHENDIAKAFEELDKEHRLYLYAIFDIKKISEIFTYLDDVSPYLNELPIDNAADILENMDSDDAVDALSQIEDEEKKELLLSYIETSALNDIELINSYTEEEIGSLMTNNFITIKNTCSIKHAMRSLVEQAKDHDNISTIYVEDEDGQYDGAIDLRDLIIARATDPLESIVSKNYPYLFANQEIDDKLEFLKDYSEDSLPVLDEHHHIIGVITAQDVVELVDDEMGEDYVKLAGLTDQEDLNEKVLDSMKKRIPWLILLLFLGMGVSSVVGVFESVVSQIAIVMCFQSLILDMAGNVGTQSLAVTIRVLMDEHVSGKQKFKFVLKEMQIGAMNGLLLGSLSFIFVAGYLNLFKGYPLSSGLYISFCVGLALFLSMVISSLVGTIIPMFFHKINIDPAVASGPLITTVNDLIAVTTYYGLATILLLGRI